MTTENRDQNEQQPNLDHHDPHVMHEGEEAPPPGVRVMAVVRWGLVGSMLLAAALAWAGPLKQIVKSDSHDHAHAAAQYICPMHPSVISDDPNAECPICGMDLVPVEQPEQKAAQYICPMHPSVVSSDPNDECPICGMDLVLVEAGSGGIESDVPGLVPVELDEQRIQLMGMRTAKVGREKLSSTIRAAGFVAVDEAKVTRVHTRIAGWIEDVRVSETGRKVQKGEVLATLSSPELLAAQRELLQLRSGAQAGLVGELAGDTRQRLALLGMSAQDIAEVERTGQVMNAVPVRATGSGFVTRKSAVAGLYFQAGAELFEVADLSPIWVLADVYESEIAQVRVGQSAELALTAYPDKRFTGKVEFIYPSVDAQTRSMRVRLRFPNPALTLRPGMYGDVHLTSAESEALAVPTEAVIDTGEATYAFVMHEGGRFEPRSVRVGRRSGGMVEVLEGLEQGETVVTTANFLLDSESRLRATLLKASASSKPNTHSHAEGK